MGHYAAQLIKNGKTVCVDFAPVINMAAPHHVALKAHEACGSVRLSAAQDACRAGFSSCSSHDGEGRRIRAR